MKRRRKLTAYEILVIRRDLALGVKQMYLAAAHGVSTGTISNIKREVGKYAKAHHGQEGRDDIHSGPIPTAMGGAENAGKRRNTRNTQGRD
jgi:hypothetical protein